MAIFGTYSTVLAQSATDGRFAAAHRYAADVLDPNSAAHRRIHGIAVGVTERIDLAGGAFALEQVYQTRPRAEAFFESHRKYIDVQLIVAGAEDMEVEDTGRLVVAQPYLAERDLIKYAMAEGASRLAMEAGFAAIFFPVDGHLTTLHAAPGPALVRKAVVKVPV
jgi:YhcH/YjgK/YiaL family protein